MMAVMILKAWVVWFGILLLAVINGGLREGVLIHTLSQPVAYVISGVLLSVMVFVVTWLLLPWIGIRDSNGLILLGLMWLLLTLAFEFTFGYIQNKSVAEMLQAYTFNNGNIWPIVLLVTLVSPYVVGYLKGWLD